MPSGLCTSPCRMRWIVVRAMRWFSHALRRRSATGSR